MSIENLPEVTFADKSIETILNEAISGYEQAYFEQTGENIKLYPGDPIRIFLYSVALREYQLRKLIDYKAKQNLLAYATGENLELLGEGRVEKQQAEKAKTTVKFVLSATQATDKIIEAGTRVSAGNDVYFAPEVDITVPAGLTEINIVTYCTVAGTIGNGYTPGQINVLVDPIPWVASVSNIDTSSGGIDVEDDDSYREKIRLAPEGFSVAGPEGAYEFFAKKYSPQVKDVKVTTPSPCVVDIRIILENGVLPDSTFIDGLLAYLSAKNRRPLTDNVTAGAPTVVNYDIDVTYYISTDNESIAAGIQTAVNQAADDYKIWQKSKIGRHIDPSELSYRIKKAGASRVTITSPVYTPIADGEIAVEAAVNIVFGGFENA